MPLHAPARKNYARLQKNLFYYARESCFVHGIQQISFGEITLDSEGAGLGNNRVLGNSWDRFYRFNHGISTLLAAKVSSGDCRFCELFGRLSR